MTDATPGGGDDPRALGDALLGMQGFSAVRARRYRAAISNLLVHRVSRHERWMLALAGAFVGAALAVGGISMANAAEHPEFQGFDDARLTLAAALLATGAIFAGWLLWVALKGGYGRRAGDVIGPLIATVFSAGAAGALIQVAWATADPVLRTKILFTDGLLIALGGGCVLVALLNRMHRQTQVKLLRIEYHLAELAERCAGGSTSA